MEFLRAVFAAEILQTEIFLERAAAILRQPASEALPLRLRKLIEYLTEKKETREIVGKLRDFEREIIKIK